jgi:hypothetical protein
MKINNAFVAKQNWQHKYLQTPEFVALSLQSMKRKADKATKSTTETRKPATHY